jgi:hypothetical protein
MGIELVVPKKRGKAAKWRGICISSAVLRGSSKPCQRRLTMFRPACGLALLVLFAGTTWAQDEVPVPSFKDRGSDEKAFVEKVGRTVVKAARTSLRDQDIKFINYDIKPDGAAHNLRMRLEYKGRATNTTYVSDINMKIDQSDPQAWKVLGIQYEDNNKSPVGANTKNVNALVEKFNK